MISSDTKVVRITPATGHKKILIVDDSKVTRSMAMYALRIDGFELFEAESSREALELMNRYPFDMIITDLRMPEVDGVELVRQLRRMPPYREVPVIMVSGFSGSDTRQLAFDAGVSSFLNKPFKPQQLQDLVRSVLC